MSPEMRIVGGVWCGRNISTFSEGYRPTAAVVKKSLFDTLAPYIEESRFLDLFAGSGAVGIEALSRGAAYAGFVENNSSRSAVLKKNLVSLGVEKSRHKVYEKDYLNALDFLRANHETFDLIFVDPPYNQTVPKRILGDIVTAGILEPDGWIIYEGARKEAREILASTPDELYPSRKKFLGGTVLILFQWRESVTIEEQGQE
jgi:16S rRNA (guanine966-N2)-methyltransferase